MICGFKQHGVSHIRGRDSLHVRGFDIGSSLRVEMGSSVGPACVPPACIPPACVPPLISVCLLVFAPSNDLPIESCVDMAESSSHAALGASSAAPSMPTRTIRCNNGVKCFNAVAAFAKQTEDWLVAYAADPDTAGPQPKCKAGFQYRVHTVIEGHDDGWLPCKHFCCDYLTEEAKRHAVRLGITPTLCKDAHECESHGDRDLQAYMTTLGRPTPRVPRAPVSVS